MVSRVLRVALVQVICPGSGVPGPPRDPKNILPSAAGGAAGHRRFDEAAPVINVAAHGHPQRAVGATFRFEGGLVPVGKSLSVSTWHPNKLRSLVRSLIWASDRTSVSSIPAMNG